MPSDIGEDPRARVSALFNALARFAVSLRPDQAEQLVRGEAKIALLSAGQQVVDPLVGLDQALKLIKGLSDEDRECITDKTAKVVLQRPGQRLASTEPRAKAVKPALDLGLVAAEIEQLPSEEAVIKHLDGDRRLTGAVLTQLCESMNVTVPPKVKQKAALQRLIADEVIGHRRRTLGF
jgi:hypothetical protein